MYQLPKCHIHTFRKHLSFIETYFRKLEPINKSDKLGLGSLKSI